MSGECSEKAISILIPQKNHRTRLLSKLTSNKLIKKYQKDGLLGLRLAIKAKRFLLQSDPNRFSLFLSNGADYSMRRSSAVTRNRQHRISETLAMMKRAGIETYTDNKIDLFAKNRSQTGKNTVSIYFSPKEVKSQSDLTRKIINSKLTGVWINEDTAWLCYHTAEELFWWYENVEKRADILIQSMLKTVGIEIPSSDALLFGNTIAQAKMCLEDAKIRSDLLNSAFRRFCFIQMDENGIMLLQILNDKELYEYLFSVLTEDLQKKNQNYILNDGYNEEGLPVLICIDCDLKRLITFKTQLGYAECRGEIICFDFQKEGIKEFCGDNITLTLVDSDIIREEFYTNAE